MSTSRTPNEDPPSISEGVGGRVTDYRINVSMRTAAVHQGWLLMFGLNGAIGTVCNVLTGLWRVYEVQQTCTMAQEEGPSKCECP